MARYFKEKVFVSKGYLGDPNEKNYLNGVDREKLVAQICLVRDSPSEEIYNLREAELLEMTEIELNHPSKKDEAKVVCKNCKRIVHKPCLEKYNEACICSMGY